MKNVALYTTSTVTAGITMVGILVTGAMSINLIEQFGNLEYHEQVRQVSTGSSLEGEYADALSGLAFFVLVISALYLALLIYVMVKHYRQPEHHRESPLIKVYWVLIILSLMMGLTSAALDVHLVDQFNKLVADGDLKTDPLKPIRGENFKLRGAYGKATLGLAIVSLICSALSLGGLIWFEVWQRERPTSEENSGDDSELLSTWESVAP